MSGALTGITRPAAPSFAEVQISEPTAMLSAPPPAAPGSGQIGIELSSGVRLTVDASVDAEALSRVIGVLAR
jgi:transposase